MDLIEQKSLEASRFHNPALFGWQYNRQCICEVPGQVPCPGWEVFPKEMTGKYQKAMRDAAREAEEWIIKLYNNLVIPNLFNMNHHCKSIWRLESYDQEIFSRTIVMAFPERKTYQQSILSVKFSKKSTNSCCRVCFSTSSCFICSVKCLLRQPVAFYTQAIGPTNTATLHNRLQVLHKRQKYFIRH